jgi:hypothetical protein
VEHPIFFLDYSPLWIGDRVVLRVKPTSITLYSIQKLFRIEMPAGGKHVISDRDDRVAFSTNIQEYILDLGKNRQITPEIRIFESGKSGGCSEITGLVQASDILVALQGPNPGSFMAS